jgi:hypothetical protein
MTMMQSPSTTDPPPAGHQLLLRAAALELAGTLNELLDALARASQGDVAWLRPLAVASAEVEFSVRDPYYPQGETIVAACREAFELLTATPDTHPEFVGRYAWERGASVAIALLHKRAIAACRDLSLRLAWSGETPS